MNISCRQHTILSFFFALVQSLDNATISTILDNADAPNRDGCCKYSESSIVLMTNSIMDTPRDRLSLLKNHLTEADSEAAYPLIALFSSIHIENGKFSTINPSYSQTFCVHEKVQLSQTQKKKS